MPVTLEEAEKLVAPEKRAAFREDFANATPEHIEEWYNTKLAAAQRPTPAPTPPLPATAAALGQTPEQLQQTMDAARVGFANTLGTPDQPQPAMSQATFKPIGEGRPKVEDFVGPEAPPPPPELPSSITMSPNTATRAAVRKVATGRTVPPIPFGELVTDPALAAATTALLPETMPLRLGAQMLVSGGVPILSRRVRHFLTGTAQPSTMDDVLYGGANALAPVAERVIGTTAGASTGWYARQKELAEHTAQLEDRMAFGQNALDRNIRRQGEIASDKLTSVLQPGGKVEKISRRLARQEKQQSFMDMLQSDPVRSSRRRAAAGTPQAVRVAEESAGTFQDLVNARQHDFGEVFEAQRKPHMDRDIPESIAQRAREDAQETLESSRGFAVSAGPLGRMQKLAALTGGTEAGAEQDIVKAALKRGVDPTKMNPDKIAELAAAEQPTKVAELFKLRSEFLRDLGAGGPDRHVATEGLTIIDNALADLGVVKDPEFNAMFANWRKWMDKPTLRRLYSAKTPEDLKSIFQGERMMALLEKATPDQIQNVKDSFVMMADNLGMKPQDVVDVLGVNGMEALYGAGAADPVMWANLDPMIDDLGRVFQASPAARRQFDTLRSHYQARFEKRAYENIQKSLVAELKQWGPDGMELAKRIDNLVDPRQALMVYQNEVANNPSFASVAIESMRKQLPVHLGKALQTGPWHRHSILRYGLIGLGETIARGSPGIYTAVAAGTGAALELTRLAQRTIVRMMESDELKPLVQTLANPTTPWQRKTNTLARAVGRVAAADAVHGTITTYLRGGSDYQQPQAPDLPIQQAKPQPPVDPVRQELATHQMEMPKVRNFQVAGRLVTDDAAVGRYQKALEASYGAAVGKLVQNPVYRASSPQAQRTWLRRAQKESRNVALGMMRQEITTLMGKREGEPEQEAPENPQ